MAFRVLNVQVKVDLYMVCRRSQLHLLFRELPRHLLSVLIILALGRSLSRSASVKPYLETLDL